MKQQINPITAVAIIAVVVLVVGGILWFRAGGVMHTDEKPPGMPPEAAASLQQVMPGNSGKTMPQGSGSAPIAGGYIQPPKGP